MQKSPRGFTGTPMIDDNHLLKVWFQNRRVNKLAYGTASQGTMHERWWLPMVPHDWRKTMAQQYRPYAPVTGASSGIGLELAKRSADLIS
jgi:hypothetical protein